MIPGITLKIGGVDYIVPPLSLGSLEVYGDAIEAFQEGKTGLAGFAVITDVVLAAIKRNYPDITRDIIKDGVDVADAGDFLGAVLDVSGLKRKAIEAGKATAAQ